VKRRRRRSGNPLATNGIAASVKVIEDGKRTFSGLSRRRQVAMAASVAAGFANTTAVAALPSTAAAAAPSPTGLSYYLGGASTTTATNAGCTVGNLAATSGQQRLTSIIGFGSPRASGGASNWGYPDYTSAQIQNLATSFINGFMYCANSTGDTNSILRVVPTTTNDSNANTNGTHGTAWANMVNSLQAAVNANGWGGRVIVYGGSDIEPSFNASVANTKAWVSNFIATAGVGKFVGKNSLDGCPTTGVYTAATTCNAPSSGGAAWKVDDLWFVSGQQTDIAMQPVPQLYVNAQAQQWYRMTQYSKANKGYKMYFLNTMSQVGACSQVGCNPIPLSQNAAYDALQNLLNADSAITMMIEGDTDVRWV
jgi:hypothetical protein